MSRYMSSPPGNGVNTAGLPGTFSPRYQESASETNMLADNMLFSEADSWYRGENVPGKPAVFTPFPGGLDMYRDICERVAADGYDGFELRRAARGAAVEQ